MVIGHWQSFWEKTSLVLPVYPLFCTLVHEFPTGNYSYLWWKPGKNLSQTFCFTKELHNPQPQSDDASLALEQHLILTPVSALALEFFRHAARNLPDKDRHIFSYFVTIPQPTNRFNTAIPVWGSKTLAPLSTWVRFQYAHHRRGVGQRMEWKGACERFLTSRLLYAQSCSFTQYACKCSCDHFYCA